MTAGERRRYVWDDFRGGSRNSLKGGGSGPEFFEGGGVRVQVRGIFIY